MTLLYNSLITWHYFLTLSSHGNYLITLSSHGTPPQHHWPPPYRPCRGPSGAALPAPARSLPSGPGCPASPGTSAGHAAHAMQRGRWRWLWLRAEGHTEGVTTCVCVCISITKVQVHVCVYVWIYTCMRGRKGVFLEGQERLESRVRRALHHLPFRVAPEQKCHVGRVHGPLRWCHGLRQG